MIENSQRPQKAPYDLVVKLLAKLIQLWPRAMDILLTCQHSDHVLPEKVFPRTAPAIILRYKAHMGRDREPIFAQREWQRCFVEPCNGGSKALNLGQLFGHVTVY